MLVCVHVSVFVRIYIYKNMCVHLYTREAELDTVSGRADILIRANQT